MINEQLVFHLTKLNKAKTQQTFPDLPSDFEVPHRNS